MSTAPWLVAGLGNPGPEYAATRHNIGFMVADELATRTGGRLARHKRAHALAAEVKVGGRGSAGGCGRCDAVSFMNECGGPVTALMDFYGVDPDHLIVVHDELDLDFDALRVKLGGGDNGHNGLKSIRRSLGTGDFLRVRAGIGRPPGRQDPAAFVLKPFSAAERADLPTFVARCADAVESLMASGLERTQYQYND